MKGYQCLGGFLGMIGQDPSVCVRHWKIIHISCTKLSISTS
jgi:hypothetical protein